MSGARSRNVIIVEFVRLGVVVATTAAGYELGASVGDDGRASLLGPILGALVGYLLGGAGGRQLLRQVDVTQERLRRVDSVVLLAGAAGAGVAALVAGIVLVPLALLPGRAITIPIGIVLVVASAYTGMRIGAARGGDLGRYVGVRGRIEVASPARGGGVKVVDSSALIDGRILDVARSGFLEGTLVVPSFVLREMQGLADAEDRRRRRAGRRGLDVVTALQQEHLVVVEVTDDDPPDVADVDGKLAQVARERDASLVTTDTALAQVAEVSGLRVLDLRQLAEAVRLPAVPGERLSVELTREGREPGQAVGYLPDGTMIVVERAAEHVGTTQVIEVTSINQTRRGRMFFAILSTDRRGA